MGGPAIILDLLKSLHSLGARSINKMKQVSVVLLLSFALYCAQAQYRVEFVLIADACCFHSNVRWPTSIGVECRGVDSSPNSWRQLNNFMDVES